MFCFGIIIILIKILSTIQGDESSLEGKIWSPVLFSDRVNFVLFAITHNCSLDCFKSLFEGFKTLNSEAFQSLSRPIPSWETSITFGETFNVTINGSESSDEFNCLEVGGFEKKLLIK